MSDKTKAETTMTDREKAEDQSMTDHPQTTQRPRRSFYDVVEASKKGEPITALENAIWKLAVQVAERNNINNVYEALVTFAKELTNG